MKTQRRPHVNLLSIFHMAQINKERDLIAKGRAGQQRTKIRTPTTRGLEAGNLKSYDSMTLPRKGNPNS